MREGEAKLNMILYLSLTDFNEIDSGLCSTLTKSIGLETD